MKRFKHLLFTIFVALFSSFAIVAQGQSVVTGVVTDVQGEPLPGVTIAIVGTTTGGYSNVDGEFSIQVDQAVGTEVTFEVSFIGFVTQSVAAKVGTNMTIVLEEDLQNLEELIVVGYDVQKKSHLTGSIAKMETHGIENVPTSRSDQLLQGRIAGVQVQNTTSEVGVEAEINIRGFGSISANAQPLIIVDGFPMEDGLGMVDANDIASVEVLKDAASAAIYGSRAANGVILVTTKSGSLTKPKYSFKTSFGIKDYHELHPIMTNQEYTDMILSEDIIRGSGTMSAQAFAMSTIDNTTNWQEQALRQATISNTNFSVSGGKEEVKYYISTSYLTDQGIMKNNQYDKFSLRSKLDVNLSERMKIGTNMTATYSYRERPTVNFTDFYRTPSFMPTRHTAQTAAITGEEEGSWAHGAAFSNKSYTGVDPISGLDRTVNSSPYNTSNNNPLSRMENEYRKRDEYRVQSSVFFEIEVVDNLKFKTSNGFNIRYREENEYANEGSAKAGSSNSGLYTNELYTNLLTENTLIYSNRFRKHDINGMLGASFEKKSYKTAGIYGIDFPTDYINTLNVAGTILQYDGDDHVTGTWVPGIGTKESFFSRLMYAYDDKYLLSASLRADGSSKVGQENLWSVFPSVSLGWRIAQEDFFKNAVSWVDALKVRASYGVNGTDNIAYYANTNVLSSANYSLGSDNVVSGLANTSTTLGNQYLVWEQRDEYNAGIDFYVLDSRLGLVFDAYYSITRKLLYEGNISSISGFINAWGNDGRVRNKGFEFTINSYNIRTNDFEWSTSLNFSHNDNRLLDLAGPMQSISLGERDEMYIARVGDPLIQFYGYATQGVWENQDQINNNASHISDVPGGLRAVNVDGTTAEINDDDLQVIGNPFPDFTWGLTNQFTYKGFDLSFLFQGSQGADLWNGDGYYKESVKYNKNYVTNRWVSEDHIGDGQTPFEQNGLTHMSTDYMVQDASYLAWKDLSIGYKFDSDQMAELGIRSLRLYASFQNLWYLTSDDYKGINVEARSTSSAYESPLIQGYQRGAFPTQRTYNFGLELVF